MEGRRRHLNLSINAPPFATSLCDSSQPKAPKANLDDLPIDSNWRYYEFYTPSAKTVLLLAPSNLFPGVTFSPPLTNAESSKFQDVLNLIQDLRQRHVEGDFAIVFIGGLKREKYAGIQTKTPHCPPSLNTYSHGPNFIPVCAFTTLSSLYLQSVGVKVSYIIVPYDEKDQWYSSMNGMPKWNNKGTFPGAYFGGEFIMESENILEAIKVRMDKDEDNTKSPGNDVESVTGDTIGIAQIAPSLNFPLATTTRQSVLTYQPLVAGEEGCRVAEN